MFLIVNKECLLCFEADKQKNVKQLSKLDKSTSRFLFYCSAEKCGTQNVIFLYWSPCPPSIRFIKNVKMDDDALRYPGMGPTPKLASHLHA